jgi:cell division protein FtsL
LILLFLRYEVFIIIPFIYILEQKINKLNLLINTILINQQIESKAKAKGDNKEINANYSDEKIQRINKLIRIHGFIEFNPEKIKKYLVNKLINK